jgi:hypothetical protein
VGYPVAPDEVLVVEFAESAEPTTPRSRNVPLSGSSSEAERAGRTNVVVESRVDDRAGPTESARLTLATFEKQDADTRLTQFRGQQDPRWSRSDHTDIEPIDLWCGNGSSVNQHEHSPNEVDTNMP